MVRRAGTASLLTRMDTSIRATGMRAPRAARVLSSIRMKTALRPSLKAPGRTISQQAKESRFLETRKTTLSAGTRDSFMRERCTATASIRTRAAPSM